MSLDNDALVISNTDPVESHGVRILHVPSGIQVECSHWSNQTLNRADAMELMRSTLARLDFMIWQATGKKDYEGLNSPAVKDALLVWINERWVEAKRSQLFLNKEHPDWQALWDRSEIVLLRYEQLFNLVRKFYALKTTVQNLLHLCELSVDRQWVPENSPPERHATESPRGLEPGPGKTKRKKHG